MSNQWSDNLRKRMEVHEEPSPEGLWEDIEEIIKRENSGKPFSRPAKVLLWGKRIAAVAAIVIMVFTIGYIISNKEQEDVQLAVETYGSPFTPEVKIIDQKQQNEIIVTKGNRLIHKKSKAEGLLSSKENSSTDSTGFTEKEVNTTTRGINKDNSTEPTVKPEKEEYKRSYSNKSQSLGSELALDIYEGQKRNRKTKWSTNLYASNLSSGSTNKYGGYGSFSPQEIDPGYDPGEPVLNEGPYEDILVGNQYREVYTDVKHRQPVTVGISANYSIDDKWGIRSGLTYTALPSRLRSGSDHYYYSSEQMLHNIGVPLDISYCVWRNEKLSVYILAGGMVEKNISGKLTTDYIIDNKLESTKKEDLSIDQLQWSLNTSVGVQYNLTKRIGLYLEPGASYYLKNKSEIETIYKEKPLNLSLRFGLNFSINSK